MDQLIVIDYQEGAGGEYIASFISAHFGQSLSSNLQQAPDYLQKWLNSHSLITSNWDADFHLHLLQFLTLCQTKNIDRIAIPYHLYKWPHHITTLKDQCKSTRFVRISTQGSEQNLLIDFKRKVQDRILTHNDFNEIKFFLSNQNEEQIKHCLNLFKQGLLTISDLIPGTKFDTTLKKLPSNDIEIQYQDFFINFTQTSNSYDTLCYELNLQPNAILLNALLERNTKNWQDQKKYLNTL